MSKCSGSYRLHTRRHKGFRRTMNTLMEGNWKPFDSINVQYWRQKQFKEPIEQNHFTKFVCRIVQCLAEALAAW